MYNIYEIRCSVNNRVYVGQTSRYKDRKQHHLNELRKNRHTNPYLQKDFNLYGETNFSFKIVESANSLNESLCKETKWININGGIDADSTYNVKGNDKDNKEYAYRKRGKLKCDAFRGHQHTRNSKLKISESLKQAYRDGKHTLPKSRFGKENSFYGKHHTKETCQKLSEIHTGKRKYTEDIIDKWIQDYKDGMTYDMIADKYNCKITSLKYIIHNKKEYLLYGLNNKQHKKCND